MGREHGQKRKRRRKTRRGKWKRRKRSRRIETQNDEAQCLTVSFFFSFWGFCLREVDGLSLVASHPVAVFRPAGYLVIDLARTMEVPRLPRAATQRGSLWRNLKFPAAHVPEDRRCFIAFACFSPALFHAAAKNKIQAMELYCLTPTPEISLLSRLEMLHLEAFPGRQINQINQTNQHAITSGRGGATFAIPVLLSGSS